MTSSVGQETLRERIDEDKDGIADQAERDFEEDSTVQPSPSDATAQADTARHEARSMRSSDDDTDLRLVLPDGETGKQIESPISAN
ncbi:MAG: hypothetical protein RLZZ618_2443 [Pseudomonadota bacterium]|jgi:hypothetical protein